MQKLPIAVLTATFSLFSAQIWLSGRVSALDSPWVDPPASGTRNMNPEMFRALAFGQLPAAVDWLLIRFMVGDPSYSAVAKGTHPPAFYDLDLASDLDPMFFQLYIMGANALAVLRSDGPGAMRLYEKANHVRKTELASYPEKFQKRFWRDSWRIPAQQAYVYLFELQDLPGAGRAFREAAEDPAVPSYAKSLAQRFEKEDGAYVVGLRLLGFMISGATSEKAKAVLVARRSNLDFQYFLYQINQDFAGFRLGKSSSLQAEWSEFLRSRRHTSQDPRGGTLFPDSATGRIATTTQYEKVMGLP